MNISTILLNYDQLSKPVNARNNYFNDFHENRLNLCRIHTLKPYADMRNTPTSLIFCAALCLASCGVHKSLDVSTSPEMIADTAVEWTVDGVAFDNGDFSGLSFSADGKRMVAAFNSAGIYWMDMPKEGQPLHFETLDVKDAKFYVSKRDCECVTLDRESGDFYYGQERDARDFKGASLYRIKAPAYDAEELVVSFEKSDVPDGNSGIEGLTWLGGDRFIVGREGKWDKRKGVQSLEPLLIFYSKSKGITDRIVPAAEIKQIAEVVYDDVRDCLWILDGDYDRILYRTDMSGHVLDRYPIPYIDNAEALLLDRARGCIWIGSDEVPSKLYRIDFKNL